MLRFSSMFLFCVSLLLGDDVNVGDGDYSSVLIVGTAK